MKRRQLLRHLREQHCVADEKGRESTLFRNELTGAVATVPNHPEPDDLLIRVICSRLEIDLPKSLSVPLNAPRASARGGAHAPKRNRRG